MNRVEKEKLVSELNGKLKKASAGIISDYSGINVPKITKLRKELRLNKINFFVVKNSIFKRAIKDTDFDCLDNFLDGPTSIALSEKDPVALSKTIMDFAKGEQNLKLKAGVLNGKLLSIDDVKKLSMLPSREILLSMLLSGFKSPHRRLVFVLNGVITKFVNVLSQISKKKEEANNPK